MSQTVSDAQWLLHAPVIGLGPGLDPVCCRAYDFLPVQNPETQRTMIEALKTDAIVDKAGGRFKLCALIQRRLVELLEGARPLVERNGRSDLEVVIDEIVQNKIAISFEEDEAGRPQEEALL